MINKDDFIKLAYTPDLTESGISYAVRSLAYHRDQMSGSIYSRLRRVVGNIAVELAFRRYLTETAVPFEVKSLTPFSDSDHYEVSLGGHRCNIKNYITAKRNQIMDMRRNPAIILDAPSIIPEEEFDAVNQQDHDLYVFTFLLGLTTNSPEDISKAAQAAQPVYLIHPLVLDWSNPKEWSSLGRIWIKSESAEPINIEIGGLDSHRNFISENLALEPLKKVAAQNDYYSLAYIHSKNAPSARLGVRCSKIEKICLIQPHEWGNIWIYGMEIWLVGYMQYRDFRNKAVSIYAGSKVFQYSKTQSRNLSVPMSDLYSLENLFKQVKDWGK